MLVLSASTSTTNLCCLALYGEECAEKCAGSSEQSSLIQFATDGGPKGVPSVEKKRAQL